VIEQNRTELVPNSSVKILQIRIFVVAPHHGIQGEAAEANEGLHSGAQVEQHLKQQPEVVAEGWLLWREHQQPGLQSLLNRLLKMKSPGLLPKGERILLSKRRREVAGAGTNSRTSTINSAMKSQRKPRVYRLKTLKNLYLGKVWTTAESKTDVTTGT
jgi:hypothetical protein